ncbi:glycerol-3-phosphate dehydrogenase [Knufia fluminis]|uniref:Glycerol-3-phosphate dehydrogenase n=1 Tax=Knufia fluminis TaxID=191047 RepID=A0AAN8ECX8_9EURO|nr:glycerol-3-phosphate dehydrogenase [Knufia fluminis]
MSPSLSSSNDGLADNVSGLDASTYTQQFSHYTAAMNETDSDGENVANHVADTRAQNTNGVNDTSTHDPTNFSSILTPAPALASSRYNRQMLIPNISLSGQQHISTAKILIIGLGGLGSPAALYLAGAGVGKLGLMDNDTVELSNLHRQVVHRESSVRDGMTKVESAIRGCRELNGEVEVVGHEMRLDLSTREKAEEVMRVVEQYDIVLDCTDNPATRYLISDLCVLLGKVLVSGAAQRLEGQITVLNYLLPGGEGRGPCYRCVFPNPPSPEMVKGCGEIGILGPVVGAIGTLMASEALRLVVKGVDEVRKPSMLLYNAWSVDPRGMFRSIGLRGKRGDCVACGDDEVVEAKGLKKVSRGGIIDGHMDYVTFCGVVEDVRLLDKEQRVDAAEFLSVMGSKGRTPEVDREKQRHKWRNVLVVDTRELHEVEMGPKVEVGVNIPISRILRPNGIDDVAKRLDDGEHDAMIFVCQQGNDSQVAAKKLLDWRAQQQSRRSEADQDITQGTDGRQWDNIFIGDIVGGYAALEKA